MEEPPRYRAGPIQLSAPAIAQRSIGIAGRGCTVVILDIFLPQEGGAQRRGQRQGQYGGEEDRNGQRDRELAIDPAGRSGEEGHRHEHRDQHQRDAHDRAGDLVHCLAGRLERTEPFLAHDPLDILDHDNGVVDEDPDCEDHAEQRQHVDREAEQPQAETCPRQRDRHDQRRDQRRAPVLQEQEHDEEDQRHGFDQRLDHFLDRNLDEGSGVVGDRPGDILRQAGTEFLHAQLDPFGRRQRVGAGGELDRHAGHRLAIERGRGGIGLRADLDAGDIAQPDACPAFVRAQDHPPEFLLGLEAVGSGDGGRDLLAFLQRKGAQRTACSLRILFADRGDDGAGGKVVGGQLVRIEPDTHGVFRTEQRDVAHTRHAAQFIDHLRRGDIAEVGRIQRARFRRQRYDHQEAGIGLPDGDALASDFLGQAGFDRAQPVLHFGLRDIDIGPGLEGQRDRRRAVGEAGGGHVKKALDPVELLLDHLRDIGLERGGVGAGIDDADRQRRRRDFRILFDRQRAQRDETGEQDAERDDPCEDGPIDEKASHDQSAFAAGAAGAAARPLGVLAICTGMPGCNFCRFDTMTLSPG